MTEEDARSIRAGRAGVSLWEVSLPSIWHLEEKFPPFHLARSEKSSSTMFCWMHIKTTMKKITFVSTRSLLYKQGTELSDSCTGAEYSTNTRSP